MSQTSSDKFLYFTVGLLKGSAALDALRQDATKYHMIDHPGQLIALRLTEYYEQMKESSSQPVAHTPADKLSAEAETTTGNEQTPSTETHAEQRSTLVSLPTPATALTNMQPQPSLVGQSHGRQPAYTPSTEQGESTITLNQLTG